MQKSTNYGLNLPDLVDQFNLNHWNENTEKLDFELKNETDLLRNDLILINDAIVNLTNSTLKTSLLNFCYPIGSLYWSSKNTNPATLFGGTWVQIKDKFILACGDTYTNGATGGSSTVTLTVNQIPSHSHTGPSHAHSYTPSGTISAHAHGLNNHTHSFTPNGNVSVTTNPTFSGTAVTTGGMSANASGYAGVGDRNENGKNRATGPFSYRYYKDGNSQQYAPSTDVDVYSLYIDIKHTHTVIAKGTVSGGAYEFIGTAGTTGGSTANTANATPTFTGTQGTTNFAGTGYTGSAGGGTAHNNMPPYIVKYCWERTK